MSELDKVSVYAEYELDRCLFETGSHQTKINQKGINQIKEIINSNNNYII